MRLCVALVFVTGCGLFGGQGRRGSSSEPAAPSHPSHLELTLVSHCAQPVEICYGSPPKCLTLAGPKPRVVSAATGGTGDLFVTLKDAPSGIFADLTFSTIEVDDGCKRIRRSLTHR
jgi:hypothetical protein